MNFITIATESFILNTIRLIRSLRRIYPNDSVTVYTDSDSISKLLSGYDVTVRVLREINKFGVKRAKFRAYAQAAGVGGFVYLDADILVLQPLEALIDVKDFTACRDDLTECPFISDSSRPWEFDTHLCGRKYFNSGVFAVPAGFSAFFTAICLDAADDEEWSRFTIPGRLYDNHFLCAKIAQHHIPINFISEYEYNWQGFRRFGELNCYLDDNGNLRSKQTHNLLRIAHFAGIRDIDGYISALPTEISQVLAASIGGHDSGILELMNSALHARDGIETRLKLTMVRNMYQPQTDTVTNPGAERSLLLEPQSVASIAFSAQETDFLWNDLKCGAAYLSAPEYKRLRDFVTDANVTAILEFGAGFTSVLFARHVRKHVALEGWDGPWLEFARSRGVDARLVPFSTKSGFEETALIQALEGVFSEPGRKMIFIDSPVGTSNRSLAIEQVLKYGHNADFYVIHDSVRDSAIVYQLSSVLGLQVIDHYPSLRGLTFLGKSGLHLINKSNPTDLLQDRVKRMRFNVITTEHMTTCPGETQKLFIHLENTGDEILTAASDGLGFSMHLMDGYGKTIEWDNARYALPVDLSPGDQVSFWLEVPCASSNNLACLHFDFVKEGEFWWSSLANISCPKLIMNKL